jgi:hypothetical protein
MLREGWKGLWTCFQKTSYFLCMSDYRYPAMTKGKNRTLGRQCCFNRPPVPRLLLLLIFNTLAHQKSCVQANIEAVHLTFCIGSMGHAKDTGACHAT